MSEQKKAVELNDSELEKVAGAGGDGNADLHVGDWCISCGPLETKRSLVVSVFGGGRYYKNEYKITRVTNSGYEVKVYIFNKGAGSSEGKYLLTYNAKDKNGNIATKKRIVKVN